MTEKQDEKQSESSTSKRFPFLQRDPDNPALLHCSHEEVQGTFVMQKLNFGRERLRERIKGAEAGASPTPDGMILAEWCSAIVIGFSKTPEDFKLDDVEDEVLIEGLYTEVTAYWASFRRKRQT